MASVIVSFRVSVEEREELRRMSELCGESMNSLFRSRMFSGVVAPKPGSSPVKNVDSPQPSVNVKSSLSYSLVNNDHFGVVFGRSDGARAYSLGQVRGLWGDDAFLVCEKLVV